MMTWSILGQTIVESGMTDRIQDIIQRTPPSIIGLQRHYGNVEKASHQVRKQEEEDLLRANDEYTKSYRRVFDLLRYNLFPPQAEPGIRRPWTHRQNQGRSVMPNPNIYFRDSNHVIDQEPVILMRADNYRVSEIDVLRSSPGNITFWNVQGQRITQKH